MALLTPVIIAPNAKVADVVASLAAAAGGGDTFAWDGKGVLFVNNGGGSPITLTIVSVADNFGVVLASHDITQSIAAAKLCIIGPVERAKFADVNGIVNITYSGVTSVTVGLRTFAVTG